MHLFHWTVPDVGFARARGERGVNLSTNTKEIFMWFGVSLDWFQNLRLSVGAELTNCSKNIAGPTPSALRRKRVGRWKYCNFPSWRLSFKRFPPNKIFRCPLIPLDAIERRFFLFYFSLFRRGVNDFCCARGKWKWVRECDAARIKHEFYIPDLTHK